jgi:hypothetical protein
MYAHLQPLKSSPSGQFADPNNRMPTFEEFTTPRSAPRPGQQGNSAAADNKRGSTDQKRRTSAHATMDRVVTHARKLSASLGKPLRSSAQGVEKPADGSGSPYEMRALMDPSKTHVPRSPTTADGKMSMGSYSATDEEDRDSGKGLNRI